MANWAAGKAMLMGWLSTGDRQIADYMAGSGFDCIGFDQQHGAINVNELGDLFLVAESYGAIPLTRVPSNEPSIIGKSLDLGAAGIIVPLVNTADDAAAAVRACRYPPKGSRSAGVIRRFATAVATGDAQDHPACIVMIETRQGVENVDAILSTSGLDAVYVGPTDLAISLGLPSDPSKRSSEDDHLLQSAIGQILKACQNHRIEAGISAGSGASALSYIRQGFLLVMVAWDRGLIEAGAALELRNARI